MPAAGVTQPTVLFGSWLKHFPHLNRRLLLFILVLAALGLGYSLIGDYMPSPGRKAVPPMPPVVDASMDEILEAFESRILADQPSVAEAWNPGITAAELAQAEAALGRPIHPEMQALYRWHNGLKRGTQLFPGYEFLALGDAIQLNRWLEAEYRKHGVQSLMAHEANWLTLFPDPAGDGYYYDPAASYDSGGVFFNFRESGYYMHFPSIKNLLAGLTECYRAGAYRGGETLDFDLENRILLKYGRETQQ